MKTIKLFIASVLLAFAGNAQSSWETYGSPNFSNGAAFHPIIKVHNNTPYVAYIDASLGYKVVVKYHNGTDWLSVGNPMGVSDSIGEYVNLEISSAGIPYLSYLDYSEETKLRVKRFNGTSWINVGGLVSSNTIIDSDLSFMGDTLFVAYLDATPNVANSIIVKKFDGTNWNNVGNSNFDSTFAGELELHTDSSSQKAWFSYSYADRTAKIMSLDLLNSNALWTIEFSDFIPNWSDKQKVIFHEGTPYIVYTDGANQDALSAKKYNSQTMNWDLIGNSAFTDGGIENIDFHISSSGKPTVIYNSTQNSNEKTTMVEFNGTGWTEVGQSHFTSNTSFSRISFDFLSDDTPIVAYIDNGNSNKISAMAYLSSAQVNNLTLQELLQVYPNPAENIVNIEVSKWLDGDAMKIVNLQGQTMKHFNGLVNQVDISELSPGTYFLVISSEGKSIHKKITKQ